jgi:hypothetical protein
LIKKNFDITVYADPYFKRPLAERYIRGKLKKLFFPFALKPGVIIFRDKGEDGNSLRQ